MPDLEETHVVTCILRNQGEVLLLRRSEAVGSYQGQWGGVAGHAEGDPDAAAWREIDEETGLRDACTLVRSGEPFSVDDDLGTRWIVHPYLFDCDSRDVEIDWESIEADWASPTEILRRDTVPQLWTSYDRVAPSAASIRDDTTHGAAYLSHRALEVLRDRAAVLRHKGATDEDPWEVLRALAHDLLDARPSMAVLRNRINRAMHACRETPSAEAVEAQAHEVLGKAFEADADAAHRAAGYVAGRRVLTLSRSGTVLDALQQADPPPSVVIAISEPGREGITVAEVLAEAGLDVTLVADATLAAAVGEGLVDVVLVGADTVLPNGSVVNKVGTRLAALAAKQRKLPFYATAASDKVVPEGEVDIEHGTPSQLYEGEASLDVYNPLFEVTPAALLSGVITEFGLLAPVEIQDVAYELKTLADW